MKAYVINLPRSSERRQSMSQQLESTELEYEFVDAVDGRSLSPDERVTLVDEATVEQYSWWLTPGQIGASLSHLSVYRRVLSSGEARALILEDDVLLPPGIAEIATQIGDRLTGSEVALLYFRGFGVCEFSSQDAVRLPDGAKLVYPMQVRPLVSAAAYVATDEACRRLSEVILPIRAGADSWGHFHDLGAIDALRCVLPRPVRVRTEFKSTIDYVGPKSVRLRATSFVARHRVFPAYQLLALNRRIIEHRMSRLAFVPERSPLAMREH